jgi:hypothetical protein
MRVAVGDAADDENVADGSIETGPGPSGKAWRPTRPGLAYWAFVNKNVKVDKVPNIEYCAAVIVR